MFTDGPENEIDSKTIRHCLCKLATGTIFLHEVILASILGKATLRGWMGNWAEKNMPSGIQIGIVERLPYLI